MRGYSVRAACATVLAFVFGMGCPPSLGAATSTISTSPATVVADGVDAATITVTVLDANGQPISGKTVAVAATGSGNTLTQPAAATNASGVATATLTSTTAEAKTITATVDGVALLASATASFVAGPAAKMTWTVQPPATLPAGAAMTPALEISLSDAHDNAAGAATDSVTLALTAGTGTTGAALGGTKTVAATTGIATFSGLTIDKVGTGYTLTATSGSMTAVISSACNVTPAALSASLSTVTLSSGPVVANGTATFTVTVHVVDALMNPLPGLSVDLTDTTGSSNTLTSGTTDASGNATATIKSTKAESKTIKVTVDRAGANALLSTQPSAQFIAGALSTSVSTVVANPSTGIIADGTATTAVTVTLLDAYSNPVAGGVVDLVSSTGSGNTASPATVTSDAAGQAVFTLKSTKAEAKNVVATVNRSTSPVVVTQQPSVTFVPGAPSLGSSTVVVTPQSGGTVVANTVDYANVLVTVVDANSNPIQGLTIDLSQTTGTNNTVGPATPGSNVTDSAGHATFTLNSSKAETKNVVARINAGSLIGQQPPVTFVAGAANNTYSTVTATPFSGPNVVANNTDYATVVVTVLDIFSNPVSGQAIDFTQTTGTNNTFTPTPPASTNASGQATFTMKSTKAEAKVVKARVNSSMVLSSQPSLTFVAGPISASASSATADFTSGLVANNLDVSTITVTAKDANSNPVQGATVTLGPAGTGDTITPSSPPTDVNGVATFTIRTTKSGLKTLTATAGGVPITQQPAITFNPGPLDIGASFVVAQGSLGPTVVADFTDYATVSVQLVDQYNNPLPGLSVDLAQTTGANNTFSPPTPVTTDSVGVASFHVMSGTAQTKTIVARVGGTTTLTDAVDQPQVMFVAGPPSAVWSMVTANPATGVVADNIATSTITVSVVDAQTNFVPLATVTVVSNDPIDVISPPFATTNGTGDAFFTIKSTKSGTKTLTATAGGVQLNQHPTVQFIAGPVDPTKCTFTAVNSSPTGQPKLINASQDGAILVVTALDQYSNPVENVTATFTSTGGGNLFNPGNSAQTNAAGQFSATLTTDAEGIKRLTGTVGAALMRDHVEFRFPADVTSLASPSSDGSCSQISYTLTSSNPSRPVKTDVLVEVDPTGTGAWRRADPGQGAEGVRRVLASTGAGTPHQFVWNTNATFPFQHVTGGMIRVTALRDGLPGISQVAPLNTIDNTMRFGPPASAPVPSPLRTIVADFNRDGIPDVAVVNSAQLGIMLGTGNGSVLAPFAYGTASGAMALAAGDFDRDGDLDIAVSYDGGTGSGIAVHLNNGAGVFTGFTTYFTALQPRRIVAYDFTRDGHLDLLTLSTATNQLIVLPGNGAGGFGGTITTVLTVTNAVDLATSDFNGDGNLDAVVASTNDDYVEVLLGQGNGLFTGTPNINTSALLDFPSHVATGDLNRDGRLDLVISGGGTPGLVTLLGNGNGGFPNGFRNQPVGVSAPPGEIAVADFDRDGILDAVRDSNGTLVLARGDGSGDFAFEGTAPTGMIAATLTMGDLDLNGAPDLIMTPFIGSGVARVLNTTSPRCRVSGGLPNQDVVGSSTSATNAAFGDFDEDGRPDLVTAGTNNVLTFLKSDGTGFRQSKPSSTYTVGSGPNSVAVGDLDGDLDDDIVTVNAGGPPTYSIVFRNGPGFTGPPPVLVTPGVYGRPYLVDLDGDGDLDFVVPTNVGTLIRFTNNGAGAFFEQAAYQLGGAGDAIDDITFADFNNDGIVDVAGVTASSTGHVMFAYGLGGGAFDTPVSYGPTGPMRSIVSGDFNDDGRVDVVIADAAGNYIAGVNDGSGGFNPLGGSGAGLNLAAVDFDGDGHLDLTFGTPNVTNFGWKPNDGTGTGTFGPPMTFPVPLNSSWVRPVDIDGDGRPDLATLEASVLALRLAGVHHNAGGGQFVMERRMPIDNGPSFGVAMGDFNRDGNLDSAIGASGGGGVVRLFAGNPQGQLLPAGSIPASPANDVLVADVNRDGLADLVIADASTTTVSIAFGNGAGGFSGPSAQQATAGAAMQLALGDFNRDGELDIALVTSVGTVQMLPGAGGFLGSAVTLLAGAEAKSLAIADLDRDGDEDLVIGTSPAAANASYIVLQNDGAGTFTQPSPGVTVSGGVNAVALADMDRDGKVDMALGLSTGEVRVYKGNGNQTFTEKLSSPCYQGGVVSAVTAADGNRDGAPELLVLDVARDKLAVLGGSGDGNYSEVAGFLTNTPVRFAGGDLDGDGYMDGVVVNAVDLTLSVSLSR